MKSVEYSKIDEKTIEDVARMFKALADPTRIKILSLLAQEECSAGKIANVLSMTPSAVSHQLSLLKTLRLVRSKRKGKSLIYTIDDEHVIEILEQMIHHSLHE